MSNQIRMGDIKRHETVSVKVTSRLSGREYEGAFTWRRRTLEDIGKIAAIQSEMTGGATIVEKTSAGLINAIAELTVVVSAYPDWWAEVKELADVGVIFAVYTRYLEWLAAPFRIEGQKDSGPDKCMGEGGGQTS